MTVALSLVPYAAAYVADTGVDAEAAARRLALAHCCSFPTSPERSSCW